MRGVRKDEHQRQQTTDNKTNKCWYSHDATWPAEQSFDAAHTDEQPVCPVERVLRHQRESAAERHQRLHSVPTDESRWWWVERDVGIRQRIQRRAEEQTASNDIESLLTSVDARIAAEGGEHGAFGSPDACSVSNSASATGEWGFSLVLISFATRLLLFDTGTHDGRHLLAFVQGTHGIAQAHSLLTSFLYIFFESSTSADSVRVCLSGVFD